MGSIGAFDGVVEDLSQHIKRSIGTPGSDLAVFVEPIVDHGRAYVTEWQVAKRT
ncbi:MAG: hypothetical protein OXI38_10370 [Bacteroidota bacterium]|nr:hypothetical protein [Bacteroidota bacterium]